MQDALDAMLADDDGGIAAMPSKPAAIPISPNRAQRRQAQSMFARRGNENQKKRPRTSRSRK